MHDDLRLLIAFDVLLDEQSVTAAAERLHLSQPAMSRTLARIRAATGDAILVRSGARMLPTPYAESVRSEVRELVDRGRAVLMPARTIDPATLKQRFRLRMNDALASAVLPELAVAFRAAPGVVLSVIAEGPDATGSIDANASVSANVPSGVDIRHEVLGTDTLVVVGAGPEIDIDAFATAGHVVVTRRGRVRDPIDDALAEHARKRRIVLTVPTAAAAIDIVRKTDLVTVLPSVTAQAFAIECAPLPFDVTPIKTSLSWHARLDNDPAERWFRKIVGRAVQDLLERPR